MFLTHRERLANPAFLAVYIALLLIFVQLDNPRVFALMLPAIAVVAFAAWMLTLRRMLAIVGTPTSKIASAAQGYVELVGRALAHPGGALRSRFTLLPCVWYQYRVEQRERDGKWRHLESGRSDDSFLLDDGTGVCLIDPEDAEVLPRRTDTTMNGTDYRCTESLILPGEQLYAIGEFTTIGGANVDLNLDRDVSELLAQWKRDKPALLKRFDLDSDGQVNEKEWMLARSQARREVRKNHNELRTQPGTHMLHKPRDARLFLLSNVEPGSLTRRYRLWAWLHLFVLIGAVVGTAFVSN